MLSNRILLSQHGWAIYSADMCSNFFFFLIRFPDYSRPVTSLVQDMQETAPDVARSLVRLIRTILAYECILSCEV